MRALGSPRSGTLGMERRATGDDYRFQGLRELVAERDPRVLALPPAGWTGEEGLA